MSLLRMTLLSSIGGLSRFIDGRVVFGSFMQRIADRKEFSAIASVFCYDFGK